MSDAANFTARPDDGFTPPKLTLPREEAMWLRMLYAQAQVILEYGSGGSTLVACEQAEKTVFSVESDADWAAGLQDHLDRRRGKKANAQIHHVDIGPTQKWGNPVNDRGWRKYHRYPHSVWDRDDFRHPDLVLVDGRFRVGCFLAVMLRITRPVTLLFDDYTDRPQYHAVETYSKPVETRGRMARFDLAPRPFPMEDLTKILELSLKIA